jgi:hypothetical protein
LTARLAQGGRLLTAWPAWLATAGLAAGAGVAWLISQAGPGQATIPDVPLALPAAVLVGWSLIGSGLLAARSRREDHLALVLIFTGFAWFASMLPLSHNPVVFTAGEVVYALYYAGVLYLILSFPAGRLQGKLDRALMVTAIALVTVGQVAWLFFADSRRFVCSTCPANLLEVARDDGIARLPYSLRQLVRTSRSTPRPRWRTRRSAPMATAWPSPSRTTARASTRPPRPGGPGCRAYRTGWGHSAAPPTSRPPPAAAPG